MQQVAQATRIIRTSKSYFDETDSELDVLSDDDLEPALNFFAPDDIK